MNKEVVQVDPRQALVSEYYKNPMSDTFSNLKGSMIKAGYSVNYASTNYNRGLRWIEHVKGTVDMIQGSERNLQKVISKEIDIDDENISKSKLELLKIQQGASQFVLKTLARQKYNDTQDKQDNAQINVNIIKQYNITNNAPSPDAPSNPYPDASELT